MTDYRKLFDLAGKTAVVLGAASGIGKSSAEALAALGASVLCADRSLDGAQATVAGIREHGGVGALGLAALWLLYVTGARLFGESGQHNLSDSEHLGGGDLIHRRSSRARPGSRRRS